MRVKSPFSQSALFGFTGTFMMWAYRWRCMVAIRSGERTRLACWRWRPRHRELFPLRLTHLFSRRDLPGSQEGFDQLALAADNQTIISGKRLNHRASGTSGSVASQSVNRPSWEAEISRCVTRSSRWFNNAGGRFCRRILGILPPTVEAADDLLANSRLFRRINGIRHALCQPG